MIIFDEDSDARFFRVEAGTMTTANLDPLVDHLFGTQVKFFVIGVNAQKTNFPSRVCQPYTEGFEMDKGILQPYMKSASDSWTYRRNANISVLQNNGIDSNSYLINRAKERGIVPWITIRMNDQHGTWIQQHPFHCDLWIDHPELRTQTRAPEGGFDYAQKKIRDYYFAFIAEVIEHYDVGGLVIDWMRAVPHFNDGEGKSHIPEINELMRHVRLCVREQERKRGHEIALVARVPSTVKSAIYYGLDGVAWANEKLVDRLILSPKYIRDYNIEVAPWRNAIHDKSFPVTVCIENAFQPFPGYPAGREQGVWSVEPQDERQIPFVRGACRGALARGSDGIYFFNFMGYRSRPEFRCLFEECGSLETLRGKNCAFDVTYNDLDMSDDDFFPGWRSGTTDAYFGPWREKLKRQGTYPYPLPLTVRSGRGGTFHIFTGPVEESNPKVKLYLDGTPFTARVLLNGNLCKYENNGFWTAPENTLSGNLATIEIYNQENRDFEVIRVSLHICF